MGLKSAGFFRPQYFEYSIAHVHCTNSGCGKSEAYKNWSTVIPQKAAPVTQNTLRTTGHVPADSRQ